MCACVLCVYSVPLENSYQYAPSSEQQNKSPVMNFYYRIGIIWMFPKLLTLPRERYWNGIPL